MERWSISRLLPCLLALAVAVAGAAGAALHPYPTAGAMRGEICAAIPADAGDRNGPPAICADCILALVALMPAHAVAPRRAARRLRRGLTARAGIAAPIAACPCQGAAAGGQIRPTARFQLQDRPMTRVFAAATAALLLALPGAALAHDGVHVHAPFALISPAGNSGAVFMRIDNEGTADDRLVAAGTPMAARVELHTHEEDAEGVMRMIEVEEGFAIPAGGERLLERGGDHVMLMGLTGPLVEGDVVTLTLTFEREGDVIVLAPVGAPAEGPGHDHDHDHDHDMEHGHGD